MRFSCQALVPSARLELAQLSPLPPQDSVSTNFTTTARRFLGSSHPWHPRSDGAGKAQNSSPKCWASRSAASYREAGTAGTGTAPGTADAALDGTVFGCAPGTALGTALGTAPGAA